MLKIPALPFEDHLDVILDGYMFRLLVINSTELATSRLARLVIGTIYLLTSYYHCCSLHVFLLCYKMFLTRPCVLSMCTGA